MNSPSNKNFFFVLIAALLITCATLAYVKFNQRSDYPVIAYVDCDPTIESCFVMPSEEENYYFKAIVKNEAFIPICSFEECEPLACESGETNCQEIQCGQDSDFNSYLSSFECSTEEQTI